MDQTADRYALRLIVGALFTLALAHSAGASDSVARIRVQPGEDVQQLATMLQENLPATAEVLIPPGRDAVIVIAGDPEVTRFATRFLDALRRNGPTKAPESTDRPQAAGPRDGEIRFRPPDGARPIPTKEDETRLTRFFPLPDITETRKRLHTILSDRLQSAGNVAGTVELLTLRDGSVLRLSYQPQDHGVLVTGPSAAVVQIGQVLDLLQQGARNPEQRSVIISLQRAERSKLDELLRKYRGARQVPHESDSSEHRVISRPLALVNFQVDQSEQESEQKTQRENGAGQPDGQAKPAAPGGGLDVDVEVQTLPDLDVLILRGRSREVQKLADLIRDLERLSKETQPEIHILHLQHAASDQVADVLQNVNEDLTGRRQGRVSVTALGKPNALLLIGWGDAAKAMIQLARKLDTPVAPQSQFQVFRLTYATAEQIASAINDFFSDGAGLSAKAEAISDTRSNSVIVRAAPRDQAEVARLVASLDVPHGKPVRRAKVVRVSNALATDLAETLQQAIRAADDPSQTPSPVLELMTIDGEGQKLVKAGLLRDVRVTANARNNTLILSGPPESLHLLEALIQQLDTPGAIAQIKVFRVINGDAASLVRMLRALLPTQTGASTELQLASAEGETSLAPLRFSVDTRTNSIIAAGSAGDLRIIEALLLRLDEKDLAERRNEVYRLRNSPAVDVATAVNEFLRSERQVQLAASGAASPFEQLEREVVVVPEPVGNSLIISATPRYFDEIRQLVEDLDQQPPQVLIQVLIAEVSLGNAREFGVELGLQDSVLFDRSLLGDLLTTVNTTQTSTPSGIVTQTEEVIQAATNQPGFLFNNEPLGNSGSTKSLNTSSDLGGQALSHFAVGRMNSELGFGGLVLSASSENISVLVRALQESRKMKVLSRPQVRTLDNQPAFIQVGQRVPRIVASNITEGGLQTNSVELENVGLILGVTPRISPDGTVVMEIDAEKSSLGPEQEGIPITVSVDGTVIRAPSINTTTAQATVSAASGETIILGGLITTSRQSVTRRVPYLADIPLVGDLFRFDSTASRRTELLIILTPHVIRSPVDEQRLKHDEMAKMSWCAADVFALHGDVGMSDEGDVIYEHPTDVIYPDIDPRGGSEGSANQSDALRAPEPAAEPFEVAPLQADESPSEGE